MAIVGPATSNWSSPTPNKVRMIGDTMLVVSHVIAVSGLVEGHPIFGVISSILGVAGKLFTDLFAEK